MTTMPTRPCGLHIGFRFFAVTMMVASAMQPGLAEEAGSKAPGDGKAAATSGEPSAARAPAAEDAGGGVTKGGDPHALRGNDSKGGPASATPDMNAKDVNTAAPGGNNPGDIDTRISVQPRRLGARADEGRSKATLGSPLTRNLHRRLLSAPRPSDRPVRNAIGIPVAPRLGIERRDGVHPNSIAAPHSPPAVTPVVPGSARGHVTHAEGGVGHRLPNANPIVVPAVPGRGAVSGTGLARRNFGPAQIGGPKASVAGINGTAIRPKH